MAHLETAGEKGKSISKTESGETRNCHSNMELGKKRHGEENPSQQ